MLDRVIDAEWVATKLIKRCDVSVSRTGAGGLHLEIEVPPALGQPVAGLLAGLGLKGRP